MNQPAIQKSICPTKFMRVILFLIGCAFLFSCEKTDAENEFRVVHLQSGSLVFASVKFNTVVFEQDSDGVITGIEFTFEDKDKKRLYSVNFENRWRRGFSEN
jgi:hypothetical protein